MFKIPERIHSLHLGSLHFGDIHWAIPGSHISARAVLLAGLASGAVYLAALAILMPLFLGASPWAVPRVIAAMTQGAAVLTPIDTFDLSVLLAAVVVHFALSMVYALLFAFIGKGHSITADAIAGMVFGLALYVVNYYLFTMLFPWFEQMRNWVTVVAHLAYGGVLGTVYAAYASGRIGHHPAMKD